MSGVQCHTTVPGSINPPAAVITQSDPFVSYGQAYTPDANDYRFEILLLIQRGDEAEGQANLDQYIDPTGALSIPSAFDTNPTLGGIVSDCNLVQARGYGTYTFGEVDYFGCRFDLQVMA